MLGGCGYVNLLKQKEAKKTAALKQRRDEFSDAIHIFMSRLKLIEASPEVSVDYSYDRPPKMWRSLEDNVQVNAKIKIKYHSLKNAIGAHRTRDLYSSLRRLLALDQKWSKIKYLDTVEFTIPNEIARNKPSSTSVIYLPKDLIAELPALEASPKVLYASLVNSRHGLRNHIVREKKLTLMNYFTFDVQHNKLTFNLAEDEAQLKEVQAVFSLPVSEACDDLRVELRIQNGNKIRRIRKPLKGSKIESQSLSRSMSRRKGPELMMRDIVGILAAPDVNREARQIDGVWSIPALNIDDRERALTRLFQKIQPEKPMNRKLCIREKNNEIFTLKTSEESLPDILTKLGISPSLLIPEESLRFKITYKGTSRELFAEPADLGADLFKALSTKDNAVLRVNKRFKEIPYKLKLDTDTGHTLTLPVLVDGLTSKKKLPKDARWRLVGYNRSFTIEPQPMHELFLSEIATSGLVQISNIRYQKVYRDTVTPFVDVYAYEIELTGEKSNWLGSIDVKTSASLWIHHDERCDLAIDITTQTESKDRLFTDTSHHVLKARYRKSGQSYVFGYADPPNCSSSNPPPQPLHRHSKPLDDQASTPSRDASIKSLKTAEKVSSAQSLTPIKHNAPASQTSGMTRPKQLTAEPCQLDLNDDGAYTFQIKAFQSKKIADKYADKLGRSVSSVYVQTGKSKGKTLYRVRAGSFDDKKQALAAWNRCPAIRRMKPYITRR